MKLIQTKEHLLLIDEEAEIKIGITGYSLRDNKLIGKCGNPIKALEEALQIKSVIAYFPLNKDSKELDLPLLPEPFDEINLHKLGCKVAFTKGYNTKTKDSTNKFYEGVMEFIEGFEEGYKAAQSKQFNLEDMQNFGLWLGDNYKRLKGKEIEDIVNEFIQLLSTQQLPKEFIPDDLNDYDGDDEQGLSCILHFKTNSEGKEEICGEYVY